MTRDEQYSEALLFDADAILKYFEMDSCGNLLLKGSCEYGLEARAELPVPTRLTQERKTLLVPIAENAQHFARFLTAEKEELIEEFTFNHLWATKSEMRCTTPNKDQGMLPS